jgi:O-antigen ligase
VAHLSSAALNLAHNTYLEHLVELGVPATLFYAGPLLLFGYCLRGLFVRRRDQLFPLVAVGATVLVALHALVDFSLQIPAVAVTYAALLGIGVAQATPSAKRSPPPGASLRE